MATTSPSHAQDSEKREGSYYEARATWAELDAPDWKKEGDEDSYDAIETFFNFLYQEISKEGMNRMRWLTRHPFLRAFSI